jgi:hypothetical protein
MPGKLHLIKPTEHQEQAAFFRRVAISKWRDLPIFAIPNGGHRHAVTAARLKAEGVTPGVPDVFVAQPANHWHGLFIEFKRQAGGSVSAVQADYLRALATAGYAVTVAKGHDAAWAALERYMANEWALADQWAPGRRS